MKLSSLFIICFLCFSSIISAQNNEKEELIQFSGRIINEKLEPLSFAHVLIMSNLRGTITDMDGMFSMVVEPNDTVMMTCIGYKPKRIVIPDSIDQNFLTRDFVLSTDTIAIKEVVVYPWNSYQEFKQAFLNVELPEGDVERARKNIALLKTQIILDDSPNYRENFQFVLDEQYEQTFNEGMQPTISLTNPIAWVRFFDALKSGDLKYDDRLKEKNKNYNRKNRQ
ncbi:MAG: hypothetical protein GVY19_12335 [Bacteroidetes bacterium]|jgi:hypothetical protein|nr:hypothetical protein [Bacteroidota bacterium]